MRLIVPLMVSLVTLTACAANFSSAGPVSAPDAVFPIQSGAPTAVSDEVVQAADAEYLLLTNIYQRASPSVVNIESRSAKGEGLEADIKRGSGFIYDRQGHIITNAHLVKDAEALSVTLQNAYVVAAQLSGSDSFSDLAVLKADAAMERLPPLPVGNSAAVKVGQRAISIGNPFGLNSSMTLGIVSGLGRSLRSAELIDSSLPGFNNPSIIQIDTPIHPGNSGGPLLDSQGLVIGITTAIRSDSGIFQGVGFAVPADTIQRVVPELIERGRVDYSWMGISVTPEDGGFGVAGLGEALGLPVERGVLLRGVTEGSPADMAGLRGGQTIVDVRGTPVCAGGDLIVAINGYYIRNLDDLLSYLILDTRPGDVIDLLVIRDKSAFETSLTLQNRPTANDRRTMDCSAQA